jgi:hypothetical protein
MAARDYKAEYAREKQLAQQRGFSSTRQQDQMRAAARRAGHDPTSRSMYNFQRPDQEAPREAGLQGPYGPTPSPDWDYYWPTQTRRPERKYTQMARYSRQLQCLEVVFRDGTPWHWAPVEEDWWVAFKRFPSTYDFLRGPMAPLPAIKGIGAPGGWGSIVGEACVGSEPIEVG